MFDGVAAVNPKDGQPVEFTGSADMLNIVDESLQPSMENYTPPDLTIEWVELVYYVPDQRMDMPRTGPDFRYLQPAWRFFGLRWSVARARNCWRESCFFIASSI